MAAFIGYKHFSTDAAERPSACCVVPGGCCFVTLNPQALMLDS